MPMTVNVGLSRKASANYQSTGTSINLTAELDQGLLARPEELQRQVQELYKHAEAALSRQAGDQQPPTPVGKTSANGNGGSIAQGAAGNGRGGNGQNPAPMTQSQSRAINAIASRLGIDPAAECREVFSSDLSRLNVRQASALIDHLKGLSQTSGQTQQPAGTGEK
ncbi:MAG: hypothetical protein NT031_05875 [Planctomycetota bacterium]|nr:hypothetical protein [Planctomycetota bacterium]